MQKITHTLSIRPAKKGKVYLVGAGTGDIGLLTLKGFKCLQKADVIVYDLHLNAQILNYITHNAEFIYAGKQGGHHTMEQDEINQTLIKMAKQGKIVCRLKGGDPFVFGRGGEEAEALAKKNIPFEIIPGISSAIAVPAYAGIPLTHRKYSSSFAVITGNEDATKKKSSINWSGLARGIDTLVFLMGIKNIKTIALKLIENGKSPETPTAVIRWGTRPDQKTVVGKLKDIADLVKEGEIKPPAVMVVGKIVKMREILKWYEDKPLFGQRILITRQYNSDYEILEELGAEIFEFPTLEIAPPKDYTLLDKAIRQIETYNWMIFTSVNGFKYFIKRFTEKNQDIRNLKGIKICAIGTKTAQCIKKTGIKVDLIPKDFNAEGLIDVFLKENKTFKGIKFLLPTVETARELFPQKIRELGGIIDVPIAYRTITPKRHSRGLQRFLREGRITIATFTSTLTFTNFLEMIGSEAMDFLKNITIAAIGPVTKQSIEKFGLRVSIMPKEATIEAMAREICKFSTLK